MVSSKTQVDKHLGNIFSLGVSRLIKTLHSRVRACTGVLRFEAVANRPSRLFTCAKIEPVESQMQKVKSQEFIASIAGLFVVPGTQGYRRNYIAESDTRELPMKAMMQGIRFSKTSCVWVITSMMNKQSSSYLRLSSTTNLLDLGEYLHTKQISTMTTTIEFGLTLYEKILH